jgi:hypothetical protein
MNKYDCTKNLKSHSFKDGFENFQERIMGCNQHIAMVKNIVEYEFVLISSDGIESCVDDHRAELVGMEEVISKITAFKDFSFEFVTKRMRRYFKKLPSHIYHSDDVSIGGFHYSPE